mgnify:CR=1 FL=1
MNLKRKRCASNYKYTILFSLKKQFKKPLFSSPCKLPLTGFLIVFLSLFFLFFSTFFFKTSLNEVRADNEILQEQKQDFIDITAKSALIMDKYTGEILWGKDIDEKLYPASTTKMLTAIIAIENIPDLNVAVNISRNASGRNSSFFSFKAGDKITLMDLLKAALITSHNNATIALAEYISGGEQEFVKLMNKKAKEIGAYNSFFQNTNGLDTNYPEHKTTARDLAIIAGYCLKNDLFKKLVETKKDIITINDKEIEIKNTNFLLNYGYIKGVKTGFTENAGGCLVAYSEKNGLNLISVVLSSDTDKREVDTMKLIQWANENFLNKKIVDSSSTYKALKIESIEDNESIFLSSKLTLDIYPEKDFKKLIKKSDIIVLKDNLEDIFTTDNNANTSNPIVYFTLPVKSNEQIGKLNLYINDKKQEEINLIIKDSVENPAVYIIVADKIESRQIRIAIFLIAFYFLIIIFIIVKNLFSRSRLE